MPRIPEFTPKVRQQGLPGVRVSTDAPIEAFGGGASLQRLETAGNQLATQSQKIFEEEKRKADDIATTEFYTKLASKKQELFWDPEKGVIGKKGKDSFGALDEYGTQFDKYADELEAGLATEEQRLMARKIRQKERLEFDGQVQRHVFQEAEKFQDQTIKAGVATARNDAVLNYHDPAKVQSALQLQESLILQGAKGKPPALVQAEIQEVRSKTHTEIVARMLANGQDLPAKAHFEKNRQMFTGEDATRLEKALEEGTLLGESQRQSDSIYKKHPGDMSAALAEARSIQDPKLRKATADQIEERFSQKKRAEEQANDEMNKRASDIIDKGGTIQDVMKQMATEWPLLSSSQRSALKSYAETRSKGLEPQTNWELYTDLKMMAATPELRSQFLQGGIYKYRNQLSDERYKEMVDIWTGLKNGDEKTKNLLDGYRTDAQIVNDTLSAIGIDPTPKQGSDDSKKVALFRSKVDEEIRRKQSELGRKVNNQELQEIVDNFVVKGKVKGTGIFGYFQDEKRQFELEPGQDVEISPTDIPKAERQKIEAALKARKLPVSDQAIVELYRRKTQSMVNRGN